jgi:hypothetical protein
MPLALSDSQLDQLFRLTRPLQPACRDEFLQLLALELQGRSDVGDGELFRVMRRIITDHSLFSAPTDFDVSLRGRKRSRG